MPKVTAEIPESVFKNISEEVKLGLFSNASEAVASALKKSYAKKSRTYLKWLAGKEGLKEADMLKELARLRK